ncbi:MAG TPA: hypothetical protein VGS21_07375, partial [Acidimicrobiales bacterium]|nr:hypothetical protein [Acidimicrobiales bacterium]
MLLIDTPLDAARPALAVVPPLTKAPRRRYRGGPSSLAVTITRSATLSIAVVMAVVVSSGLLYWLRGALPLHFGPVVPDALPLDELPGNASVPLVEFAPVIAVVAAA